MGIMNVGILNIGILIVIPLDSIRNSCDVLILRIRMFLEESYFFSVEMLSQLWTLLCDNLVMGSLLQCGITIVVSLVHMVPQEDHI